MVDYDPKKNSWYSPIKIIREYEKLRKVYGDDRLKNNVFKRAREMFAGALALLGAYELSPENTYWLQSNNQSETPDVMGATQKIVKENKGITLLFTQMEIVEIEEHTKTNNLVDFLNGSKLSKFKSYTEYDTIVLIVNKLLPFNHKEVYKQLVSLSPKPTIYVIGRPVDGSPGTFSIFSAYPTLTTPLKFDVFETASKYSMSERVDFNFAIEKTIIFTKLNNMKPVNTYEILDLNQELIKKKFKIPQ